jgi:two-component system NtrC family sensor kinase
LTSLPISPYKPLRMRLAYKVSVGAGVAMLIALGIDTVVGVRQSMSDYESEVLDDAARQARTLSGLVPLVREAQGDAGAVREVDASNQVNLDVRARWVPLSVLLSEESLPLGKDERTALRSGTPIVRFFDGASSGERWATAFSPVLVDGKVAAAIQVMRPATLRSDLFGRRVLRALVTTLLLFALSWGLTSWLGFRWILQPISRLAAKAKRTGTGDFGTPLELNTGDELAFLAEALNSMCAELAAARDREKEDAQARLVAMEQVRRSDRLATVGRLAAEVAHEVGTPLNVIAERTKMARAGEVEPNDLRRTYEIILDQAERITKTIRQLLRFARQRATQKTNTNLRTLLESVRELLEPIAKKKGIQIRVDGPDEAYACVDGGQMGQVLVNLVVNGIQAMQRPGTITLSLRGQSGTALAAERTGAAVVRLAPSHASGAVLQLPSERAGGAPQAPQPDGEYWTIAVADEGSGISDDQRAHLFEPFFSTRPEGQGTGLGLSIVHGIVLEHGGWLAVSSEPGRGATFTVSLPAGEP